jgi:hypothetical protein
VSARAERLILAAGLLCAFALCLGPIFNPDLGWHLAAGRFIAESGRVPRADFLSWSQAGRPWIDFEWGAQLVFHVLDRLGGLPALWVFKTLSFFGVSLMLTAMLRQWEFPAAWIGFALPPFAIALFPMSDIRPEVFSLLLFMAQFWVLERRRLGLRRAGWKAELAGHVAAYAVWANLHAGFVTGLALCVLYGAAEAYRRRERPTADSPLAWAAAGVFGTCLNPYGPAVYTVFLEHWRQRAILRVLVIEWEEPNFFNSYMNGYWALVAFSFTGFILAMLQGLALPAEHLAAFSVFALFASRAFRTTSYAALLAYPLSLTVWRGLRAPGWWPGVRPWLLAAGTAVALWRTAGMMQDQRFQHPLAVLENYGPAGACRFVLREKATLGGLRLYNPWNWGGYLDRYLYPDFKVSMDGRYLFTDMLGEIEKAGDTPDTWRRYLDRQGVDLALLVNDGRVVRPGSISLWRPFITYAMPRSDWALVYWDQQSVLLVRRSKVPAEWLKPREYRLLRPHDTRYLGLLLTAGDIGFPDVEAEIARYEREIGDPIELLKLKVWLGEFRKGLPAPRGAAGSRPRR